MDTCAEFAALLDLYVDGELPPAEAACVQAHLETCDVCRSYVEDIQAIRAAFPSIDDTPVPDGFADGVMAAIRAGNAPQKHRSPRWVRIALPLAACLAIFAVVQVPLLQRDTAADQAAQQEQTRDTSGSTSNQDLSHQETADTDEQETVQVPAPEEAPVSETTSDPDGTISPKTTAQAPAAYYSLQDTPPNSTAVQEDPAAAADDAQSSDEAPLPDAVNGLTAAPTTESDAGEPEEASVFALLSLSAAQAGNALDGIPSVAAGADGSLCYHLTPDQYDTLLEALSAQGETPEPSLYAPELRDTAGAYAVVTISPE